MEIYIPYIKYYTYIIFNKFINKFKHHVGIIPHNVSTILIIFIEYKTLSLYIDSENNSFSRSFLPYIIL